MAWGRIIGGKFPGSGANGGTLSPGIDITGSDTLFLAEGKYDGGTQQAPTDNLGNTGNYAGLTAQDSGLEALCRLWYVKNAIVGSNYQPVSNGTGSYPSFCVDAWSGGDLSAPYDGNENGAASGISVTSIDTGSITPNEAGALVIAILAAGGTGTQGVGSISAGFTLQNTVDYVSGNNEGATLATQVLGAPSAVDCNFTAFLTIFATSAAAIAAFKPAIASALPWFPMTQDIFPMRQIEMIARTGP